MLSASGSNLRRGRTGRGIECIEVPELKEGHISPRVWTTLKVGDIQVKMGKPFELIVKGWSESKEHAEFNTVGLC